MYESRDRDVIAGAVAPDFKAGSPLMAWHDSLALLSALRQVL